MVEAAPRTPAEDETTSALRAAGAGFAFVHGSRAAGDSADIPPDADLDVAAWWGDAAPAPWDVAVPDDVDLLVLDGAPLELAGRVALHGRLMFDDDPPARVRWQAQTRLVYLDEQDRQRALDRVFLDRRAVVDERRVRRLLQRVTDDLAYLSERARSDRSALAGDHDRLAALKYVFVTAIGGCLEVAQHLCASEGWGPPASNPDALRLLGRHGVLDADLAEAMDRAVSFRNVLVHSYVDVDDRLVVGFLDHVTKLDGFVRSVPQWMQRQSP